MADRLNDRLMKWLTEFERLTEESGWEIVK